MQIIEELTATHSHYPEGTFYSSFLGIFIAKVEFHMKCLPHERCLHLHSKCMQTLSEIMKMLSLRATLIKER